MRYGPSAAFCRSAFALSVSPADVALPACALCERRRRDGLVGDYKVRKGSEVRPAAISKFLAASEEAIEDFEPRKREIDEIEMSQPSQQFAKPQTPGHKKRKPNALETTIVPQPPSKRSKTQSAPVDDSSDSSDDYADYNGNGVICSQDSMAFGRCDPQKISKHQRALLLIAFVLVLCASAVKGVAAARRGEGAHRAAARLGPVARQHYGLEPVRAIAIAHGVPGGFEGEPAWEAQSRSFWLTDTRPESALALRC